MEKSKKSSKLINVIVKTPLTAEESALKIKELSRIISEIHSNLRRTEIKK